MRPAEIKLRKLVLEDDPEIGLAALVKLMAIEGAVERLLEQEHLPNWAWKELSRPVSWVADIALENANLPAEYVLELASLPLTSDHEVNLVKSALAHPNLPRWFIQENLDRPLSGVDQDILICLYNNPQVTDNELLAQAEKGVSSWRILLAVAAQVTSKEAQEKLFEMHNSDVVQGLLANPYLDFDLARKIIENIGIENKVRIRAAETILINALDQGQPDKILVGFKWIDGLSGADSERIAKVLLSQSTELVDKISKPLMAILLKSRHKNVRVLGLSLAGRKIGL